MYLDPCVSQIVDDDDGQLPVHSEKFTVVEDRLNTYEVESYSSHDERQANEDTAAPMVVPTATEPISQKVSEDEAELNRLMNQLSK